MCSNKILYFAFYISWNYLNSKRHIYSENILSYKKKRALKQAFNAFLLQSKSNHSYKRKQSFNWYNLNLIAQIFLICWKVLQKIFLEIVLYALFKHFFYYHKTIAITKYFI